MFSFQGGQINLFNRRRIQIRHLIQKFARRPKVEEGGGGRGGEEEEKKKKRK